jgi:hypothetical protein
VTTIVNGETDVRRLHRAVMSEKNLQVPLLASMALVIALTIYCHISAIVEHSGVTLGTSIAWAIRVSAGWIMVTALLWRFSPVLFSGGSSQAHPRIFLGSLFLACCSITLLLDFATSNDMTVVDFLFRRVPAVSLGNCLLIGAVCIVERRRRTPSVKAQTAEQSAENVAPRTIEVMTGTGRTQIQLSDVECFEADGNYINVIHKSGRRYLLRQTLLELQKQLDHRFSRVHRSTIVNCDAVVERRTGGVLVLGSEHTVRVSRRFSGPNGQPSASRRKC